MRKLDTSPRTVLRAVWWVLAAPLAMLGLAGCYLQLGPVGCLLMAALIGGAAAFVLWQMAEAGVRCRWPPVPAGLVVGGASVAITGLVAIFEVAGLVISTLLVLAAWVVFGRLARRAAQRGSTNGMPSVVGGPPIEVLPPDPLPEPAALPSLSTAQLCWVWRVSYVRVHRAVFPGHLEHLAEVRCACLAELQRRDPAAFSRWFPTARAASDPARFFCHQPQT